MNLIDLYTHVAAFYCCIRQWCTTQDNIFLDINKSRFVPARNVGTQLCKKKRKGFSNTLQVHDSITVANKVDL